MEDVSWLIVDVDYYIGCSVVSAAAHNHKVSYRLISSGVYVFISWSRVCVCIL